MLFFYKEIILLIPHIKYYNTNDAKLFIRAVLINFSDFFVIV